MFLGWGPSYDFKKPNPKLVPYRLIYSSLLQRNVQLCGRKTVWTCLVGFALKHKAHSGPFLVHKRSRQTLVDPCAPLRNFRDPMTSTAVHLSALRSANNRLFPTVWNKVFLQCFVIMPELQPCFDSLQGWDWRWCVCVNLSDGTLFSDFLNVARKHANECKS